MDPKNLYKYREHCEKIKVCCHKNVNRIVEMMVKHKDQPKPLVHDLGHYLKHCVVLEKLCEYLASAVCNLDRVSNHCHRELMDQCHMMGQVCKRLIAKMPKEDAGYVRCKLMMNLCQGKKHKKTMKKH